MNEKIKLLDHGYLQYIEHYGSDERIIEAARMSTGKGFLGWEPGVCPTCEGTCDRLLGTDDPCNDCNATGKIPGDLGLLRRLWVKKHATQEALDLCVYLRQAMEEVQELKKEVQSLKEKLKKEG